MSNIAVIGMGYGDEGKGVVTQWLCSRYDNPIVVRFSGGHQCGHTVTHNNITHTFSNFGSGTLLGCPTFWSKYCTFEPVGFWTEFQILRSKGINPLIYIDSRCPVTTPFDIYMNRQSDELSHGTCGVGFYRTLNRHREVKFTFGDLCKYVNQGRKIKAVKEFYNIPEEIDLELFFECIRNIRGIMGTNVRIIYTDVPTMYHDIIFEGSQGIMLDQRLGHFPHVTPSNTTPRNIIEMGYKLDEVFMVSRGYLTRHGNGPMNSLGCLDDTLHQVSETNMDNEYQGVFRKAVLNADILSYSFIKGITPFLEPATVTNWVFTCLDHLKRFTLIHNGNLKIFPYRSDLMEYLVLVLSYDHMYINDGHTSKTIRKLTK